MPPDTSFDPSIEHTDEQASAERPAASSVYAQRVGDLEKHQRALQREHVQLGYLRLSFGIAVLVLLLHASWLALLPLLAFALAARIHQKVLGRLAAVRRGIAFYQHGLARLEDRWAGLKPRQPRVDTAKSLFAADLDLFGPGSLFELLCGARTSIGEDVLAGWLLSPGPVREAQRRQEAVAALRERTMLREAFASAPGPAVAMLDQATLLAWSEAPPAALHPALRVIAPVLVLLTLVALWRYATAHTPVLLIGMLLIDVTLTFVHRQVFKAVFVEAERVSKALGTAASLLAAIESEPAGSGSIEALQFRLRPGETSASKALRHLEQLTLWAEARSNYVVRILDAPLLYSLQFAIAVERWRRRHGSHLRTWLDTLAELESLLSLAGYSFEHPDDPFPEFQEEGPRFLARELGHPLLPADQCVRNDVSLDRNTRLLLISGSNMSGKSTLLRSVGINAVLAFAGAPVRARSLQLSLLHVGASIHVQDSLHAGRSRFYAEILRLREITMATEQKQFVLFLIDEVLAGTNSSDRLAGAHGLVDALLTKGAIGLLSTHDLALTELALSSDAIRNVHFEDQVTAGKLIFDYKLREGVVERSNGLALMRLIGLDV